MDFLEEVAKVAKDLGLSYEKEESVRIHIGGLIMEISPSDGGGRVVISMQLPSEDASPEDVKEAAENFGKALSIAFKLGGELRYELDTSLPSYPYLYIVREYDDAKKLVDDLRKVLGELRIR